MSVYKIIVNGPFFFGESIHLENGDTDDVCSFCGELCTHKSSCSNRYNFIQGNWEILPEGVQRSTDGIETIPVCDDCYVHHDIGNYGNSPSLVVFYTKKRSLSQSPTFSVDSNFRAND